MEEQRLSPIFDHSSPPPLGAGDGDVAGGGGTVLAGAGDQAAARKKRGRPRKYDAEGNLNPAYRPPPQKGDRLSGPIKGRGKHAAGAGAGSSWQFSSCLGELFANTAGRCFTPHVLTVHTGEDVVQKILSFSSQQARRGVSVLSANGAVSNVTIRQAGTSGGLLTYEGRFEILSLNGTFTFSGKGGMKSRMGGLSISLAGVDGRVIGGGLAGLLIAASPIQMVVASFLQNGSSAKKRKKYSEPRTTPLTGEGAAIAGENVTILATPVSEVSPNQVLATQTQLQSDDDAQQNPNTSSDSGEWNISDLNSAQRSYPDINVSLMVD